MNRLALFLPLALFVGLSLVLLFGLDKDPTDLPSALVGEAFPEFMLPTLQDETKLVSQQDLQGQVLLVNVWATWCFACRIEHPNLNELAEQGVVIVGLNYKDQRNAAKLWLLERGNPYSFNIFDDQGSLGIDLGVYGAPETYLVDADGVIRHRRVGVVDKRVWDSEFSALYQELTGKTPIIGGVR
ncbi:DsbE family thiol:disulfide interchange protein [Porticoccaceae bacterium]|jgi:cytochrome c biogenesis protein CcmG/thiol:disulfide interchange protein DsbE|nr:DsbE family thiol:disulfide interchange protein [Porticoccaceae bacterium]CAI8261836.1 MAG: Thiol:disulfide interchange protein DsbE [SAR92 bacterium MED-G29]|tara:strand:- start:1787 stop:2341 length:555 start_codon:yes stop_codon:yes gene_type:complete